MLKKRCIFLRKFSPDAFTLIELLIVVAIISILSSIAVPNFLEAQTRAKVSRVKADMAAMATALEIYAIDHNNYPHRRNPNLQSGAYAPLLSTKMNDLRVLTTPMAYMTRVPDDIFELRVPPPLNLIDYFDEEQTNMLASQAQGKADAGVKLWLLLSVGPDGYIGVSPTGNPGCYPPQAPAVAFSIIQEYDPNNGTISSGNVYRMQGNASFTRTILGK
jgi:type II secretion system protein G